MREWDVVFVERSMDETILKGRLNRFDDEGWNIDTIFREDQRGGGRNGYTIILSREIDENDIQDAVQEDGE